MVIIPGISMYLYISLSDEASRFLVMVFRWCVMSKALGKPLLRPAEPPWVDWVGLPSAPRAPLEGMANDESISLPIGRVECIIEREIGMEAMGWATGWQVSMPGGRAGRWICYRCAQTTARCMEGKGGEDEASILIVYEWA